MFCSISTNRRTIRTRTLASKPSGFGDVHKCNLQDVVHRAPARGHLAISMVSGQINDAIDGVALPSRHNLARLECIYNVHGPCRHTTGVTQRSSKPNCIIFSATTRPPCLPTVSPPHIGREPDQSVPALSQSLHQRAVAPGFLGLSVSRCTGRILVVPVASRAHLWDGIRGKAEYIGYSDRIGRIAWDAL
jgi:hypothetical protein